MATCATYWQLNLLSYRLYKTFWTPEHPTILGRLAVTPSGVDVTERRVLLGTCLRKTSSKLLEINVANQLELASWFGYYCRITADKLRAGDQSNTQWNKDPMSCRAMKAVQRQFCTSWLQLFTQTEGPVTSSIRCWTCHFVILWEDGYTVSGST